MIPLVSATITAADVDYVGSRVAVGLLRDESEIAALESAMAERLSGEGAIAVNSGTSGLHLAMLAAGVRPGDEIIMPTYTCVALLNAARMCGADPVLVDNQYDVRHARFHGLTDGIADARTPKTGAVLISHMFGTLLGLDPLQALGVPVIEDITLSLGARHAAPVGAQVTQVTSLHWSKMISSGQGGMVVCHDPEMLVGVRTLSSYDTAQVGQRYMGEDELRGSYELEFSYKMSSLQAALGVSQLRQLDTFIDRRRSVARYFTERFDRVGIVCPVVSKEEENVFFRYLVESPRPVREVLAALLDRGIQCGRGVFPPLHVLVGLPDTGFPNAMRAADALLSVPVHPALTDAEVEYVADQVCDVLAP